MNLLAAFILGLCAPQDDALPRALALDEPRKAAVQDPAQEKYPTPEPPRRQGDRGFVDFDWLEVTPGVGIAVFTPNYRTDPSICGSVRAHVPMPWLNPSSDPTGEYFGLFVQGAFTTVDRDLSHAVNHRKGMASFFTVGADFSILRDATWVLAARAGLLYAYYGGVADLKSGIGPMVGLTAGIQISGKMALTYNPEVEFGDTGSRVFFHTLGLLIQF
jgi:hypothetical protein